jgi:hypothetical protein
VDPYASPRETKIGGNRPTIQHVAETATERRTRSERLADKAAVRAQRRAIKKGARRHLKQQMLAEVKELQS